jgi:hypothetical protein
LNIRAEKYLVCCDYWQMLKMIQVSGCGSADSNRRIAPFGANTQRDTASNSGLAGSSKMEDRGGGWWAACDRAEDEHSVFDILMVDPTFGSHKWRSAGPR